jgi:prepilin-type N-terminal cleavage/methylation domain-containing protein
VKGVKNMRTLFENRAGFTLVELAIGLVIIGLLIGAILGGAQMIKNAKIKRQINDLQGLYGAVYTYFDRFLQLPGDYNADGYFDIDSTVWNDIESEELAYEAKRSPFGAKYYFGSDTAATPTAYRNGNYVLVSLPVDVAENVDKQLDDGIDSTGIVTSDSPYTGTGKIDVYYFLD